MAAISGYDPTGTATVYSAYHWCIRLLPSYGIIGPSEVPAVPVLDCQHIFGLALDNLPLLYLLERR